MTLFEKLISYIHHPVFDKEPHQFIAFRIRHTSVGFSWGIADRVLVGYDGTTVIFSVNLQNYTLLSLIDYLCTLPGVSVTNAASPDLLRVSAETMIPGSGRQAVSNGDIINAYTSMLWMYIDVIAFELASARDGIVAMIDQMSIKTADDNWLDEWGGYFGVPRLSGESDPAYSNRIIIEVTRPRGNNKAIEQALFDNFGQSVSVTDLIVYKNAVRKYSGAVNHNSAWSYDATADAIYGLFQVVIGYDLLQGGDQAQFSASVRVMIEKFRDAGTQLDSLSLSGSEIADAALSAPVDTSAGITTTTNAYFDGDYRHNGVATYIGTAVVSENL